MSFDATVSLELGRERKFREVRAGFPTHTAQPTKLDLNKKSLPKQKTIQNFDIDAQVFRKTRNENPSSWEIGVTS